VDAARRRDTMRNHTATHLLNWALAKVLGDHINQAGSVVAPDRLRFDFTHGQSLTAEQIAEVERLVNERILDDVSVVAGLMPLAQAKQIPGVRAVFGEKYPDPVRVIFTGGAASAAAEEKVAGEAPVPPSAEFCGGTHLDRTGQVGPFKIVSEESVAKGVRRITAVTAMAAVRTIQEIDAAARQAADILRTAVGDLPARVEAMQKEIKTLRKAKAGGAAALSPGDGAAAWNQIDAPGGKVIVGRLDGADTPALRTACDVQRQKGAAAVFVAALTDEKVTLVAMVSEELAKAHKLSAGDGVKAIAPLVGGSGGGKPTLAQAGGRDAQRIPDALREAGEWAKQRLA
jgi:alanyl-tRNA synthetase